MKENPCFRIGHLQIVDHHPDVAETGGRLRLNLIGPAKALPSNVYPLATSVGPQTGSACTTYENALPRVPYPVLVLFRPERQGIYGEETTRKWVTRKYQAMNR